METKKTTREEYQKCVNAVVDYINLHLGEEIDLKSLAKISHFSPFYFHRIMKAFLGEPIGTFIVRTRTETAARLLRYTDLPIADIAYRIGYSSSSSLSKVFKQFYGISPLEYRNNKNFVIMKPAIIRPELKLKREIKELPVRNVIYIRLFGDYKLNDYCGTWMRLQQFVQEEKLPMGEVMPYCIFHDDPKVTPIEKLRTDVCMVMPAAVTPKGNIGFKHHPHWSDRRGRADLALRTRRRRRDPRVVVDDRHPRRVDHFRHRGRRPHSGHRAQVRDSRPRHEQGGNPPIHARVGSCRRRRRLVHRTAPRPRPRHGCRYLRC